ncbi:NADH-quinone oxidoreductase subunit J family protein [Pseudochryseolinea flava]|uniref:NADH-quinone oxidoreductase subunit J n=1 Tax=Pseudochryseolinea flava TaxID=2059302 RepID=A0A364XZA5_9BACT|nr:NADH-quinone oxidoreductase subunit J [Pseudochryseolinea flava]RAV99813.1 hypothetical protein DQQ10_17370 [Pseudochryseolinea flava]
MSSAWLLYCFEAIAALSALGILFVRNVFYGALLLICCLLAIAAVFVFNHAEFVAVTQILVYAGGVLVLIVFGIMLSARHGGKPLVVSHNYLISGVLLSLSILGILIYAISKTVWPSPTALTTQEINIEKVGVHIMSDYLLPFEIAGVLLLVALIGAIAMASSKSKSV